MHQPLNTHSTTKSGARPSSRLSSVRKPGTKLADENVNPVKRKPSLLELTAKASDPTATPPGPITNNRRLDNNNKSTTTTSTINTRPRLLTTSRTSTNTTTKATSSRPVIRSSNSLPAKPSRNPLQPRDRNVAPPPVAVAASRTPALAAAAQQPRLSPRLATSAKMPPANNPRQPQMPTLAKPAPRAPLTPKIAGAKPPTSTPQPQQQQQRPLAAYSTPLPRRSAASRPESSLGISEPLRDDTVSPASGLIGYTNVTPRSGPRQSRVDSTNSTPTGTPQAEQQEPSWDPRSSITAPIDSSGPRRPIVSFSPAPSDSGRPTIARPSAPESKFFYASSVKGPVGSQNQPPPSAPPLARAPQPLQKASTFCYANGDTLPPKPSPGPPLASPQSATFSPSLGPTSDAGISSKFMYANGVPDVTPTASKPGFVSVSRPGSSMSSTSRVPGRPASVAAAAPSAIGYGAQRPVSPLKQPFYSVPKAPVLSQPPTSHPTPPMNGYTMSPSLAAIRPSHETSPVISSSSGFFVPGHARNRSLTAMSDAAGRGLAPRSPSETSSGSLTGLGVAGPAMGFASLLQAADDFIEETEAESEDDIDPDESLDSISSTQAKEKDAVDELVSNARRERKVQDLEITNASLEAINRTLERQLRKQTAELRRYRRLSRSGRLSLASVGKRIASDSTVEGPLRDPSSLGLEDLSEEGEGDEYQDDPDANESPDDFSDSEYGSASGSSQMSPSTLETRDARHRRRDEKRLQLDLTKHQQLLIDSQKINQSLKRCLGWTEELIKEGRRALEYQVRVSEVEIGGRVLVRNDDEDDDGDLMHSAVVVDFGHEDDTINNLSFTGKGPQDRDSGIDLPPDGG
ncbi:hypothetical protein PpBr36_07567 [Pyricularia pennisetigena]|uniref:hypothetical protein n=1 Tax=Pyricularia pennisetigena TaxID=1578925 RepID=UPI0011520813|nr:hypothetical protein PpBr36_07567 [Pyricularia pennisetigena]TLS25222.1 hypothetical protein PpBr36_07567 [Pyricularia pennisetigena]